MELGKLTWRKVTTGASQKLTTETLSQNSQDLVAKNWTPSIYFSDWRLQKMAPLKMCPLLNTSWKNSYFHHWCLKNVSSNKYLHKTNFTSSIGDVPIIFSSLEITLPKKYLLATCQLPLKMLTHIFFLLARDRVTLQLFCWTLFILTSSFTANCDLPIVSSFFTLQKYSATLNYFPFS